MSQNLREVARLFLKLGFTAFGGPAAHIAMMHDEVVKRGKWIDDQEFLDLLGATKLIPGPNSTEMSIHLSYLRAGWRGLIVGGIAGIARPIYGQHHLADRWWGVVGIVESFCRVS